MGTKTLGAVACRAAAGGVIVVGIATTLGCENRSPSPPIVAASAQRKSSCDVVPTVLARKGSRWSDSVTLPSTGRLVLESHLATTADSFDGRPFPATVTEGIDDHLARSCAGLRRMAAGRSLSASCAEVYRTRDHRQFTPPEGGGVAGQGAMGRKPPPEEEAWIINMMFARASLPRPGERWLVSANGRSAVVVAGYEVGPSDQRLLAGVQGEVHWYLGTGNADAVTVHGPLRDQALSPGPIRCE